MRKAASRNERAYPSRPSDQDPEWLARPGSRYCANPGEAYGSSAVQQAVGDAPPSGRGSSR